MAELIDFLRENRLRTEAIYKGANEAYKKEMLRLMEEKLKKIDVKRKGDKFIVRWTDGPKAYVFEELLDWVHDDLLIIHCYLILKSGKLSKQITVIECKLTDNWLYKYEEPKKPEKPEKPFQRVTVDLYDHKTDGLVVSLDIETKIKSETAALTNAIVNEIRSQLGEEGQIIWHRVPTNLSVNSARVIARLSTDPELPTSFWKKLRK